MEEKDLEVDGKSGVSEEDSKKSTDEAMGKDVKETDNKNQDNGKKNTNDEVKSEDIKKEESEKPKSESPKKEEVVKAKEDTDKKESPKEGEKKEEGGKKDEAVKAKEDTDKKESPKEGEKKEEGGKKDKGKKASKKDKKKKAKEGRDKKEDPKEEDKKENLKEDEKKEESNKEESKEDEKSKLKEEANKNLESVASEESVGEEDVKNKKKKSKWTRIYAASILVLGLAIVYFGGVHYFKRRFLPNTVINYTNAGFSTIDELDKKLQEPLRDYSLEVVAREGERHIIRARDVDLHYKLDKSIDTVLATQEVYKWPMYLFKKNPYKVPVTVEMDNYKLDYVLSNYNCLTESSFKEARDAYIASYSNAEGYVIEKEYDGTRLDVDKAKETIKSSLTALKIIDDLDADGLYDFAKIKEDDAHLLSAQDILNKHAATVINYVGGAVLNGERISQWIGIDNEGNLILDEGGIRAFVDELAEKYDTLGKTRVFKTTDAREVEILAKKYGWQVDKEGEFQAIKASILAGEQVDREPLFSSRAVSLEGNDFGNTYVEIDLGNQKLYYYVDGQLTLSSDIVSGALWGGRKTPAGLYKVNYKARNVVLRGPDYAAPVRYWMPFNGGIGMHDANWRSSFGGGIYKSGGSHGCINMPSSSAKALYDIINKDCPVICYY